MDTESFAKSIRLKALEMTSLGKSSHIGAILSMTDIVAVLYGKVLDIDPNDPNKPDRDRFILSKGHAGAGVYAALGLRGFFSEDVLKTHYQDGSILSGHVSHKGIPGVEFSTGSLGHGLPVATGMALAAKRKGKTHRVFTILGDGECDEGSIWEAALNACHHGLDNLTVIIDWNKIQSLTWCEETLKLEPFADKWRSFGWEVREVDGHNHGELIDALESLPWTQGKPSVLLAHTVKGRGVSFMENQVLWHYRTAQGDEYTAAKKELED